MKTLETTERSNTHQVQLCTFWKINKYVCTSHLSLCSISSSYYEKDDIKNKWNTDLPSSINNIARRNLPGRSQRPLSWMMMPRWKGDAVDQGENILGWWTPNQVKDSYTSATPFPIEYPTWMHSRVTCKDLFRTWFAHRVVTNCLFSELASILACQPSHDLKGWSFRRRSHASVSLLKKYSCSASMYFPFHWSHFCLQ